MLTHYRSGDGERLTAGEEPAGGGGRQREGHGHQYEGEHRDPTEIVEVVEVRRRSIEEMRHYEVKCAGPG
jgi:hypothetical protein